MLWKPIDQVNYYPCFILKNLGIKFDCCVQILHHIETQKIGKNDGRGWKKRNGKETLWDQIYSLSILLIAKSYTSPSLCQHLRRVVSFWWSKRDQALKDSTKRQSPTQWIFEFLLIYPWTPVRLLPLRSFRDTLDIYGTSTSNEKQYGKPFTTYLTKLFSTETIIKEPWYPRIH